MEEKDLIKKLNKLSDIKPTKKWKQFNREILFNQISSSTFLEKDSFVFNIIPQKLVRFLAQPAMVIVFISLMVVSASFFSARAARDIKPGGSLFIARVISEKAQLVVTFNQEAKNKLDIKFANDHAKDITRVLADLNFNNNEDNKNKSEKLTQDFKKEISLVKTRINEINSGQEETNNEEENKEIQYFSANLLKEEEGMKVKEPEEKEEVKEDFSTPEIILDLDKDATSSIEEIEQICEDEICNKNFKEDASQILDEAEELFDNEDYQGAYKKLEEVDTIIESDEEEGEVKGVADIASTTLK